jgi:hypothetical protein
MPLSCPRRMRSTAATWTVDKNLARYLVTYDLHGLVSGEVLVTMLILLYICGKQAMVQFVFQQRRRSNMAIGAPSAPPEPARTSFAKSAWEAFISDEGLLHDYRVTSRELEYVKRAALLGGVSCKEDILFILKTVRGTSRQR